MTVRLYANIKAIQILFLIKIGDIFIIYVQVLQQNFLPDNKYTQQAVLVFNHMLVHAPALSVVNCLLNAICTI